MSGFIYFLLALGALIAGYFVYGTFVSKVFGVQEGRSTPCKTKADGIDYVEMSTPKVFLIQLLNIAGLGPVFGPILGAVYGPIALFWIVFGCIFAGAVHDYLSGMMSVRYGGMSLPDIVGYNLGNVIKQIMRVFSVVLLVLVGVVFVAGPAGLLKNIFAGQGMNIPLEAFIAVIFLYYFIATCVPVDKIIGKIYPFFGVLLVFMAVSLIIALPIQGHTFFPTFEWTSVGANGLPAWPLVFITIACGACSGFHATQSPLMARCMQNEKHGRFVFYGGMIAEGIIGLIWVTLGMSFYPTVQELIAAGAPPKVVFQISTELLGTFGGIIAVLGVCVLPITSGDTAFRASRLIIADALNMKQDSIKNCLMVAVPLFVVGVVLSRLDFNIIWRYFGFANQSLAAIALWAGAAYLLRRNRFHWVATVPACFMTIVSVSYICFEPTMGFKLSESMSNIIGCICGAVCLGAFFALGKKPVAGAPDPDGELSGVTTH